MRMPYQGTRLVDEPVAGVEDVEVGVEVLAAAGGGARAQLHGEPPERPQYVGPEGRVGARPEASGGVREQRVRRVVQLEVEGPPLEALAEAAEQLEQQLRRGVQLQGEDQSGHAGGVPVVEEHLGEG